MADVLILFDLTLMAAVLGHDGMIAIPPTTDMLLMLAVLGATATALVPAPLAIMRALSHQRQRPAARSNP
jgi:hypothetical protein